MSNGDDTLKDLERIRTKILKELEVKVTDQASDVRAGLHERLQQVDRDIDKHMRSKIRPGKLTESNVRDELRKKKLGGFRNMEAAWIEPGTASLDD